MSSKRFNYGINFQIKENITGEKVPHANHDFNNQFWLSAWLKWRILYSALTNSGTLKLRIGKYKQTTVYVWLYINVAIRK